MCIYVYTYIDICVCVSVSMCVSVYNCGRWAENNTACFTFLKRPYATGVSNNHGECECELLNFSPASVVRDGERGHTAT